MSDNTNVRIGAGLTLLAILLMSLATFMLTGGWAFSALREVATILLIVWLLTGSNVARWIVGLLSAAAVAIGVVGAIWLASRWTDFEQLTTPQQTAFGVFAVAIVMHAAAAWFLLLRRGSTTRNPIAEQTGNGDASQRPC